MILPPKCTLLGSAVFAKVHSRDKHTDRPRYVEISLAIAHIYTLNAVHVMQATNDS